MSSETEKVLEMVATGQITADQGDELIAAMKNPGASFWRCLLNPLANLSARQVWGLTALAMASNVAVAWRLGVRFDGALDLHLSGQSLTWAQVGWDFLASWLIPVLLLWGAALVAARRGRLIDFVGVVALARLPLVASGALMAVTLPSPAELMARIAQNPLDPVVIIMGVAALPFLAWFAFWLFQGFRHASGLAGAPLWLAFIGALLLAEVASKGLLWAAPSATTPSVAATDSAEESVSLTGDTAADRAQGFLELLEAGKFHTAWQTFNPKMREAMSETSLMAVWTQFKVKVGELRQIEARPTRHRDALTTVDLVCAFASTKVAVRVVLDSDNRVTGLWFVDPKDAITDTATDHPVSSNK